MKILYKSLRKRPFVSILDRIRAKRRDSNRVRKWKITGTNDGTKVNAWRALAKKKDSIDRKAHIDFNGHFKKCPWCHRTVNAIHLIEVFWVCDICEDFFEYDRNLQKAKRTYNSKRIKKDYYDVYAREDETKEYFRCPKCNYPAKNASTSPEYVFCSKCSYTKRIDDEILFYNTQLLKEIFD
jgi:acetyl-CoA carboxylase beta subunit